MNVSLLSVEGALRCWGKDGAENFQFKGTLNFVNGGDGYMIATLGAQCHIPISAGCCIQQQKLRSKHSTARVVTIYLEEGGSKFSRVQFTASRNDKRDDGYALFLALTRAQKG